MRIIAILLLLSSYGQLCAQNRNSARQHLKILTSDSLAGRGYVQQGDWKAARYIAQHFSSLKLKSFQDSYFQSFQLSVNTFPKPITVNQNKVPLEGGISYMVNPCSPSLSLDGIPTKVNFKKLLQNEKYLLELATSNKFLLFDKSAIELDDKETKTAYQEIINFFTLSDQVTINGIIELTNEKLTWSVATQQCQTPMVHIYKSEEDKSNTFSYELAFENNYEEAYPTQNVIGYIEGSTHPDSFLVFSAHYDHLGMMGTETYYRGANDNAAGVAMLLDLATYYSLPANQPKKSIVFMAFAAEEAGLLGSRHYVQYPLFPLHHINFLFNIDLVGTGSEGATVVNATLHPQEYSRLEQINERQNALSILKKRGKAANSDHYYFSENDVPAFFLYTMGGPKAYHDPNDVAATLPLTRYTELIGLLTSFMSNL